MRIVRIRNQARGQNERFNRFTNRHFITLVWTRVPTDHFTKIKVVWNRRPSFLTSFIAGGFGLGSMSLGISNYLGGEASTIWPIFGLAGLAWLFARLPGPALIRALAYALILASTGLGVAQIALLWGAQTILTP